MINQPASGATRANTKREWLNPRRKNELLDRTIEWDENIRVGERSKYGSPQHCFAAYRAAQDGLAHGGAGGQLRD